MCSSVPSGTDYTEICYISTGHRCSALPTPIFLFFLKSCHILAVYRTPQPLATVKLNCDKDLRENRKGGPFSSRSLIMPRAQETGVPCWARQVGRESGLIKAVSNVGRALIQIHVNQGQGLSWQLLLN